MMNNLKETLKTGMLVRTRNNTFGYVLRGTEVGDVIKHIGSGGFSAIDTYNDDLTMNSRSQKGLDIEEIYATKRVSYFLNLEELVKFPIWKRVDEPVALTMEELIELVGKPFTIVGEKKTAEKAPVATKTVTQPKRAKEPVQKAKPATRKKVNFVNDTKAKPKQENTVAHKPSKTEDPEESVSHPQSWEREETLARLIKETKQEMNIPVPIGSVIEHHTKRS